MNAAEATDRLGWAPFCDCGHRAERHPDAGACTDEDSYGVPCSCPSYDVEPQVAGEAEGES